jgi:hypothetical protein
MSANGVAGAMLTFREHEVWLVDKACLRERKPWHPKTSPEYPV